MADIKSTDKLNSSIALARSTVLAPLTEERLTLNSVVYGDAKELEQYGIYQCRGTENKNYTHSYGFVHPWNKGVYAQHENGTWIKIAVSFKKQIASVTLAYHTIPTFVYCIAGVMIL